MRVFCLHNPDAGKGHPTPDELEKLIVDAGHDVEYRSSDDGSWCTALEGAFDLHVAAGGDGTVGKLARELTGRGATLAVLPLGTANNIASALGLRGEPLDRLVSGWRDAVRRPFDVGTAHGPWGTATFLESVGIGLLAESIARIDSGDAGDLGALEPEAQLAAARDVCRTILRTMDPIPVEVVTRGGTSRLHCLMLEVMNFGAAGPRLRLTPAADAHDGLLDVVAVEEHQRGDLATLLEGPPPRSARVVGLQQVDEVTIECAATTVHIDDRVLLCETAGDGMRIDLAIRPGAFTVLVPREAGPG